MRSLEEPDAPRGRGLWILLGLALIAAAVAWYAASGPASSPAPAKGPSASSPSPGPPSSGNDRTAATERRPVPTDAPRSSPGRSKATAGPRPNSTPSAPAAAPRELRVTSDVPGAYVFLDRKFLGTTPFTSRDVTAGTHQLNVQIEGRPPVVQSVEIATDGLTDIAISIPAAKAAAAPASFSAEVAVVHQHAVGSCEGTLRASGDGLRYDTPHKDAFSLPYARVETLTVNYIEKRLRLKQRGGRTWNFTTTAANADPLFVFHRDVEAARPK